MIKVMNIVALLIVPLIAGGMKEAPALGTAVTAPPAQITAPAVRRRPWPRFSSLPGKRPCRLTPNRP